MAAIPKFVTGVPKHKETVDIFVPYTRADSATEVAKIPKGWIPVGAYVIPATNCDGTTGTVSIGYSGGGTELINAFNVSTNDAGYHAVGAKAGADLLANTKTTSDKVLVTTFTAGDSTAGGAGVIKIEFVVAGPNESITS